MKYIVENFDTYETIAEFQTEEQRQAWLDQNVTEGYAADGNKAGYTADGIRISIYEI